MALRKPACGAEAQSFGQLDRFMHGGVVGNALQPEQLVEPQVQQGPQRGVLGAAVGFARDQPVQRALPADHAIDQFLAQSPVRRRKRMAAPARVSSSFST